MPFKETRTISEAADCAGKLASSISNILLSGFFMTIVCLLSASQEVGAETNCVVFENIQHCAVGAATLLATPDGSGLEVSNLGPSGSNGVASIFPGATLWSSRILHQSFSPGETFILQARAEDATISSLAIQAEEGEWRMSPEFTGGSPLTSFSVLTLLDGLLQTSAEGVSAGDDPTVLRFGASDILRPDEWPQPRFENVSGRCEWGIELPVPAWVQLPDGQLVFADTLEFVEEVRGAGHYPYTSFDEIVMLGQSGSFTIFEERFDGP